MDGTCIHGRPWREMCAKCFERDLKQKRRTWVERWDRFLIWFAFG